MVGVTTAAGVMGTPVGAGGVAPILWMGCTQARTPTTAQISATQAAAVRGKWFRSGLFTDSRAIVDGGALPHAWARRD